MFLFQNKRLLLNGNTSDTTPGDHCFHYIFIQHYVIYIMYLIVMNTFLYFDL